jgi:hypothetical protein
MDKVTEFKYLPELSDDVSSNCPILIMEGQYKGIVYRYGKISLKETENQEIDVTMEIDIIKAPENFDQSEKTFTHTVGQIFTKIVEQGIEQEPVDLEDDVHHD